MASSNPILCHVWALIRQNGFSAAAWHVAVAIIQSSEGCITFRGLYTFDRAICCAVRHNYRARNCILWFPVDILRQIEGRNKTISFKVALILPTRMSLLLMVKFPGFQCCLLVVHTVFHLCALGVLSCFNLHIEFLCFCLIHLLTTESKYAPVLATLLDSHILLLGLKMNVNVRL